MSAQDEIGPSGRFRNMPAWRVRQLAAEVKGLAGAAVHHARASDANSRMAACKALEKIQRLVAEDGDD